MDEKDYCIPVERDQRGFTVSSEWMECDLPFPTISDLKRKLKKPFEIIEDDVNYNGEFLPATIYIFKSDHEIPLAVLKPSELSHQESSKKENIFTSYLYSLKNNIGFTEYVFPEQKTRLDAVFIQPYLSRFDDTEGKSFFLSQIAEESRVLIIGPAGGGKTTFLRNFVKTSADACLLNSDEKIPVYIQCRNFYEHSDLRGSILKHIKSLDGEGIIEQISSLLDKGRLWFTFDGLDEVPLEHRARFSKSILDFASRNKRCNYFVTSRLLADNTLDNSFLKISINPFNESQITEFTYHKLHSSNMWRPFIERIKEEPEISEIVGNPLALGLILARYQRNDHTPHLMTEVLSDVIDLFVDQWDSCRGIVRSLTKSLSAKIVFRVLSRIAELLNEKKVYDFSNDDVYSTLRFVIEVDRDRNLLEEIGANTSLICKKSNGRWEFTHRCVQEYLSAVNMVDELSGHTSNTIGILKENRSDNRARYLRYLLGTVSDATDVVSHAISVLSSDIEDKNPLYLINYAFAERVSVEPNIAEQYSELVSATIGSAINKLISFEVNINLSMEMCIRIEGVAATEAQADDFSKLLTSIRILRDGSLSTKVMRAIEQSDSMNVRKLADLLKCEGVMQTHVEKGKDNSNFTIEIVRMRMDIT
jgi:NACHT domain